MFNFSCVRIITEAERIQLCERIAEKISADYGCEKAPVLEWLVTSGYGRGKNVISACNCVDYKKIYINAGIHRTAQTDCILQAGMIREV